ncbi:glutaredoxin family protein [bacterium]|jgi:glutaredoxin-like YruB-family protein|nr:glutaredoxin family protein [bacterium]
MKTEKKIKIYATATCPYCKMAKSYLDENKLSYEYFDVGASPEKRKEMVEKSEQMGVPVIDIDGKIIVGFDKTAIKEALEK